MTPRESGPRPAPLRQRRLAFTLVEMMIVIAIMGLALATGIPAFVRARPQTGMRKAVSDMMEACGQARAQAILRGVPMELVIIADGGRLFIQPARQAPVADPAATDVSPPAAAAPGEAAKSLFSTRLDDAIAIELLDVNFIDQMKFPEAHVRFFPNGTCDEFSIVLLGTDGTRRYVTLEVTTALARMETDPSKWMQR